MVFLSSLAAAAGASVWNQMSAEDFMQNYFPNYLTTGRNMMADQVIERKYFEYEMRIERQNLHRDDIRDLMELTVGRMDIYHVVGTLILTFCITWFTDAQILQANVPDWFRSLFLISNFSAVGYLVLSVWLAMHASIAAHSVGVRLLTSFARLSIPSHEELKKLRITFIPKLQEFKSIAKQHVGWLKSKMAGRGASASSQPEEQAPAAQDPDPQADGARDPSLSATQVATGGLGSSMSMRRQRSYSAGPEQNPGEDDTQHFIRYLKEQKKWLGYDAYARVCMSLGMNQMLQALSYYVVGVLCVKSFGGGIAAFFGVKVLSFLLLKLDISEMGSSWREYMLVLFFMAVPSVAACSGFLLLEHMPPHHKLAMRAMITPCFLLHGLWILYVVLDFRHIRPDWCCRSRRNRAASIDEDEDYDHLPTRIRTVNYLGVCDAHQRRLASKLKEEEAQGQLVELKAAREEAEELVRSAERKQPGLGEVLKSSKDRLAAALDAANARSLPLAGRKARREMELAARAADKVELLHQAPEIHATLRALRDDNVSAYLSEEQKKTIEESYQDFLQQCRDLNLSFTAAKGEEQPLIRFNPQEIVNEVDWADLPDSVWVSAADGTLTWNRPQAGSTSFASVVEKEAAWMERARRLAEPHGRGRTVSQFSEPGPAPLEIDEGGAAALDRDRRRDRLIFLASSPAAAPAGPKRDLIPPGASPDHLLPRKIVTRFTEFTCLWWVIAAIIHVMRIVTHQPAVQLQTHVLGRLATPFAEDATFLEISALNCNASHVLLSDQFSLYAAERQANAGGIQGLVQLGEAGLAAELSWLASSGADLSSVRDPRPVRLPPSWRVAAAAWGVCGLPGGALCQDERIAGWDGSTVVVASAHLDKSHSSWQVTPRFRVHPGLKAGNGSLIPYVGVRALHLSPDGEELAVLLSDNTLDMWNLSSGMRTTVSVDSGFTAVCSDGWDLLLVRQTAQGPMLETAALPHSSGLRGAPEGLLKSARSSQANSLRGSQGLYVFEV